eukprot:g9179.t1
MNGSAFPPRTLSVEETLKRRFQEGRYNGRCFGDVICVDNLGQYYDEDKIRSQLKELLPGVVSIRFSGLHYKGVRYKWGWCMIKLSSREAAVRSLCILDHLSLKIGQQCILRPLIAHFPNWEVLPIDLEIAARYDSCAISLHLGQPSNMDRLSWEFVKMERVLLNTRQNLIDKIVEKLKPLITKSHNSSLSDDKNNKRELKTDGKTIWLKNVSLDVTQDQLDPLFKCFDEGAIVERVIDSTTDNPTNNVLVSFSTQQKTQHVLKDIQNLMLLCRSVIPMTATLFDPSQQISGFESVFNLALEAAGVIVEEPLYSSELVFIEKEDDTAKEIRSLMDEMQHQRSEFSTFKHQERLQLAQRLSNQLKIIRQKFNRINTLINRADTLSDMHS